MKFPEFNLFSDKSARIFLIFPSICPNFHGFPKFGRGQLPPPVSYAYEFTCVIIIIKVFVSVIIIIKVFVIDLHCQTKFRKKF
jgi:hypothetical protein